MNLKALQLQLKDHLKEILPPDLCYKAFLNSENSAFVRLNHGKVRQPGSVHQAHATLDISQGERHFKSHISLSGEPEQDLPRLRDLLIPEVENLSSLDPDPHMMEMPEPQTSEFLGTKTEIKPQEVLREILDTSEGLDLVGIYASGRIARSYFDSAGSDMHHETDRSHFDFSVYAHHDKAVKCSVSGEHWDRTQLERAVRRAKQQLPYLHNEAKGIKPGRYRSYLAPSAVGSVLSLLSWSAFSEKSHQTGLSPLKSLRSGERSLHESITVSESPGSLQGPLFNETGFLSPEIVPLIENGKYQASLVSPRSGNEFGISHNGASLSESPNYLSMEPGNISEDAVLKELGTGVFISDLWYLNFSDPQICRMTGMTRFASFWVEDGQIVAPLSVMRFDDSIFNMFGDQLQGLTSRSETFHEAHTYSSRNTSAMQIPGALIDGLTFTL